MRRLLSFSCEGVICGASLDAGDGAVGVLMATGGGQTRVGSHRMSERLAAALVAEGVSCMRFDRRGVGDSGGTDPGYRGCDPDLAAAAEAFGKAVPQMTRVIGLGLCDGASALALFGARVGLDGLILVNPWLVEASDGAPAPQAIKAHYRERLRSREGWRKLLTGGVSYRKLFTGLGKIAAPASADLASDIAQALDREPLPLALLLARKDMTAMAAATVWASPAYRPIRARAGAAIMIDTDSHTFARPGDDAALVDAVQDALARFTQA